MASYGRAKEVPRRLSLASGRDTRAKVHLIAIPVSSYLCSLSSVPHSRRASSHSVHSVHLDQKQHDWKLRKIASIHHEEVLRPDWLEAQYRHCSDCGCRFRIVRLRPGKAHSHDFAHTVIDNPRVYSEDFSPYQASLNTSRRSMSRVPARPRPRTRLPTSRASQSADTLWDVSLVLLPRSGSVSLPLSSSHMYSN